MWLHPLLMSFSVYGNLHQPMRERGKQKRRIKNCLQLRNKKTSYNINFKFKFHVVITDAYGRKN